MRQVVSILLAASFALAGPPAPAAEASPPIEAFAALPQLVAPQLSPDGRRYASLVSTAGARFLFVVPLAGTEGKPQKLDLPDDMDVESWQWVTGDWLLLTVVSSHPVEGETFRVRRAFGLRATDAKLVPIGRGIAGENGADILWVASDDTPRALIAMQQSIYPGEEKFFPEVFEVDISTGKMTSRAKPQTGVMDWYADGKGNVRAGIRYNESRRTYTLLHRLRNGELFRTLDRADMRAGEALLRPALFLADPGKALAYTGRSGFSAVHELDLATLELGREVFSVPGYDVGALVTDASGTQLLGVRYADTAPHTTWLEPLLAKAQRDLDRFAGASRRAHIVSMSRSQRQLIALVDSPSDPGTYYFVDLEQRSVSELALVQPSLKGVTLGPVRSLRYRSRDGLAIEAVLTLPPGREARGLPLVVMPHGGPESRDIEDFDWWAQYVAHLGYAVIQPNYRGSTGYGREFLEKGQGQWGLAMQDDLLDAIDHLAGEGLVDPRRVCIAGASYGGYAAIRAAQRDTGRYRCAISFAGISSLNEMLQYDRGFLYGATARDGWLKTAPDLRSTSPIEGVEQFTTPLLLVHGVRDLRVPRNQSRRLAERMERAGKAVRHVEQPLGDHHLSREEDRRQFLQELTDFLRRHNPPD